MEKQKSLIKKIPFKLLIILLIILIGIGFIIWSVINIVEDTTYNVKEITTNNINNNIISNEKVVIYNKSMYLTYPSKGDYIGKISIPVLNKVFPIYEGTTDNELKKGVGHYIQSALPGESDNSVISGHRETVFKNLGKLVIGDLIIITTTAGVFTYEVYDTKVVDKDDTTVIVPSEEAILTMTTCYPFNYVGSAPQRYIVSSRLIESK